MRYSMNNTARAGSGFSCGSLYAAFRSKQRTDSLTENETKSGINKVQRRRQIMQTLKSETKSWGFIKLVILGLAFFNFTALGQIQTYNIVSGFSDQSNPSGVWSYGYKSTNASFTLYPTNYGGAWGIFEY